MIKGYPDVPTETTPEIIIGVNNMDLLKRHFKATYKTRTNDQFKDAVSSFDMDERKKVALIYLNLRETGFYPVDIDNIDNIVFATRTRNIVLDESPMPDVNEQRKRIRESVGPMIEGVPDATGFQDYKDYLM
jgi:hypothetical protein